jgi:hypothetical protein
MNRTITLALAAGCLTAFASAQADDCNAATGITGTGTYAFNTSGATDSAHSPCAGLGTDVFWNWTATATENVTISTCGAGFDSTLAAYDGAGCPTSAAISCNDDSCGLQSSISISAVAGSVYLIQVGSWNGGAGGAGNLDVSAGGGGGGGGCANPASGPDVIVGDLPSITKYSAVGGVSAYALATTSCNVGDAELDWISNQNLHPVIGQNIFRYEDGRFEQLGLSWLKHGFFALQQGLCCTCQNSGTGSRLGVGCSDPYSSSLNGSQTGLGPRFEVNAATGGYSYPFTGQGSSGNSIYKRCQVANSDVNPATHAGAVFYGEGHYIAHDDAASGNQANNASYRRLNVGSGNLTNGWNLSLTGATVREEPAIRAWATQDPTVVMTDAMVPGDGMFIVGSNATDNGDGTWHYEYAVHNLFSDRSCGDFSVPLPAGASVTNIGFHDVNYHSGEPFSGTDWSSSISGGSITWSTQTFGQNVNANAIRWGTLYNFRFDANVAPVNNGDVNLGLFKPGGTNSILAEAWVPDGGGQIGTNYCTAVANSTGVGASISALGSDAVVDQNFTLVASDMPNNQFGYFIVSATQGLLTNPGGSQGNLCLGGQMGRFVAGVANSGGAGQISLAVNLNGLPGPINVAVLPGDTWNFVSWYRDQNPSTTSNFTDGLSVTFQ